ncbi:uncharacterized protein LOC135835301 [Planococcus citri]|uniref:uncharacterized protein LOC135835301 n=1 Tax=Planococcus citri TaxID=170843 RepID=UPI0031F7A33B
MNKFSIAFLMNFLTTISAPDTEPQDMFTKTTYYEAITEDKAVKSLRNIRPSEALPLVLYMDNTSSKLGPPETLGAVFVGNWRIINPTQFTSRRAGEQMFFCPEEDSDEKCLVRKNFLPLDPLECSKEPELVVAQDESEKKLKCGPNNAGEPYILVYEICPDEIVAPETSDNFSSRNIRLYEFCYDEKEKKVFGTLHQIMHPKLLGSEILSFDRSVHYHMKTLDGFDLANQKTLETAIAEEESSPRSSDDSEHQDKKQKTNQPVYRAQKLVPEEDMAFALWIKPIFQYVNFQLQHEKLIPLWNEISSFIRVYTADRNTDKITLPFIITSVVQLTTATRRDDGQISNVWGKLIYFTEESMINSPTQSLDALVILMNNYVEVDIKKDHSTSSNSEEKIIDDYCQQSTCEESLKRKFEDVGGSIRCCAMTNNVSEIFGSRIHKIEKMTRIPGINGTAEAIVQNPIEDSQGTEIPSQQ